MAANRQGLGPVMVEMIARETALKPGLATPKLVQVCNID